MRKKAETKLSKYIEAPTWNEKGKLTEGDSVDGYLISIENVTTKYGDMYIYVLETAEGPVKLIGQADIRNQITNDMLNCHVWVTFDGLVETKNGAKKGYTVEFDDEDKKVA